MPESNLKQGWRHNQKKNISETNFKAVPCKQQLKKKDFSTPLKFTLACSIQSALGSSICSNEMLLDTTRAKVFILRTTRKKTARGREQTN